MSSQNGFLTTLAAVTTIVAGCVLVVWGVAYKAEQEEEPEPQEHVVEVYEPEVWYGRVECRHSSMTMLIASDLVDYIVTAQPSGWMWEMFHADGTVSLYQQPGRIVCAAIATEET